MKARITRGEQVYAGLFVLMLVLMPLIAVVNIGSATFASVGLLLTSVAGSAMLAQLYRR